mmetsp:Transcript_5890/g.9546  ORF Transcript_5890/g.9546 Transcript_5890/m.9546 type:complete len:100 (+) Transcript_5890:783-1082(+)
MKDETVRRTRKTRLEETGEGLSFDEAAINKPNPNQLVPKRALYIGSPTEGSKRVVNMKENRTRIPAREIVAPQKTKPVKTPNMLTTTAGKMKGYYPSGT